MDNSKRIAELEAERERLEKKIAANTNAIIGEKPGFIGQVNAWTRNRARLSEIENMLNDLRSAEVPSEHNGSQQS